MASIGNSLFSSTSDPTGAASTSGTSSASSSGSATDPTDALGNEGTFLQLLVAQLQNQDPSQPQDGTQFVSQLAQFSDLEQNIGMKTDLDDISAKYTGTSSTASNSSTTADPASSGNSTTQNQSGTSGTQQLQ